MKLSFLFTVYKHEIKPFHYDFRIHIGSEIYLWVMAKGPTLDNTVKRLAKITEDDHEQTMLWDEGSYVPEIEIAKGERKLITDPEEGLRIMQEGMKKGELKFTLHGKKLKGSFALIKTHGFAGEHAWLMIKHNDEYVKAGYNASDYDIS